MLSNGIAAALAAAALFGASTPLAKLLLAQISPWLLAALLYLGSGVGLWLFRQFGHAEAVRLNHSDWCWLAAAIVAGGVAAPLLLMFGLSAMAAADVSLLLNAEAVLTALLAWFVFKENFDRRIALGMLAIVAGALLLALFIQVSWPPLTTVVAAALLGFACYGISLVLFVVALRQLGTARTGAYFALAPFFGATLAILLLGEALTPALVAAALLMAVGVLLHLSERHQHHHHHDSVIHAHSHLHAAEGDPHHDHPHDESVMPGTRHSHPHQHIAISHSHRHFPDAHHQHRHEH